MADDKFFDIINKLQNDEQPSIQNDSLSTEGLRNLNEGFRNSTFSLQKSKGHSIEVSEELK